MQHLPSHPSLPSTIHPTYRRLAGCPCRDGWAALDSCTPLTAVQVTTQPGTIQIVRTEEEWSLAGPRPDGGMRRGRHELCRDEWVEGGWWLDDNGLQHLHVVCRWRDRNGLDGHSEGEARKGLGNNCCDSSGSASPPTLRPSQHLCSCPLPHTRLYARLLEDVLVYLQPSQCLSLRPLLSPATRIPLRTPVHFPSVRSYLPSFDRTYLPR